MEHYLFTICIIIMNSRHVICRRTTFNSVGLIRPTDLNVAESNLHIMNNNNITGNNVIILNPSK